MSFYELSKPERVAVVAKIKADLLTDIQQEKEIYFIKYFSDDDTYIRKSAYLNIGRIYFEHLPLQKKIISLFKKLQSETDFKIRQTVINAAGEIGIKEFEPVEHFFDTGLFDHHHSPRNAVIGSIKKMGEKNPKPVLKWAKKYLHHPDKEIRREICHGIELRGRTHPQDILPLLKELQFDTTARVKNTLVHVIGQIAYKKGCLETVITDLNTWKNKEVVLKAIDEIIDVHYRYRNFSILTQKQATAYIEKHFKA
ncbi:MAG: HEAT repeat domain-containing protein [Bacteroidetes bacterium]|nr:HEAT repeat domain-containing protein [Bacteroidota bacterium]